MQVKIITARFSSTLGGFDTDALDQLCRHHDVLSFREHLFQIGEVPHLACIVVYQPLPGPTGSRTSSASAFTPPREHPADSERAGHRGGWRVRYESLDERERSRFATLREWRNAIAREEGVPPYVVLTNQQVISIAQRDPDSATSLGQVVGIGPAKLKRHGAAILALLGKPTFPRATAVGPGGDA